MMVGSRASGSRLLLGGALRQVGRSSPLEIAIPNHIGGHRLRRTPDACWSARPESNRPVKMTWEGCLREGCRRSEAFGVLSLLDGPVHVSSIGDDHHELSREKTI
jgi:hypothetical protein